MRCYPDFFIILLFLELSLLITLKCLQIKLSCVVEDAIEAEQFSFKSHASFC